MNVSMFFSNMKLRNKLMLSYMSAILIPVLIIGFFSVTKSQHIILDQSSQINEIGFNQMKNNLSGKLASYLDVSSSVLYEQTLLHDLNVNYSNSITYLDKYLYGFTPYQNLIRVFNLDDFNISIYTTNQTIIQDKSFIHIVNPDIESQAWYQEALLAYGRYTVEKPYAKAMDGVTPGEDLHLSISRMLSGPPISQYTHILRVEVPEIALYRLIEEEGGNKAIYLIDAMGNIMTATQREWVGKNINQLPEVAEAVDLYRRGGESRVENREGVAFCSRLDSKGEISDWILVSMVPSALLLKDIRIIIQYIAFICGVSIIVALLFIIFFSGKVTSRLTALVNNMAHIREGQFEVLVNFPEKDEFGELSRNFSSMIERINNLINEVYLARMRFKDMELQKKQAEINALQSQINPHFLFNTMESVRMSVLKHGDMETSDIIQRFSSLLRKSIDWGTDLVTIEQEMGLVDNYLVIQKFRFRSKLSYEIQVDPDVSRIPIPKFSIQPLVENAICHGIEQKAQSGSLGVSAVLEAQNVLITVWDDGVGMSPERSEQVHLWMGEEHPDTNTRIGLANVSQRLRFYYGSECQISIESHVGRGTTVRMQLPLTPLKPEDNHV